MCKMERITVFDGEFWAHKNFPPVKDDTVDEFVDCVKELAARLAAYEETGLEPKEIERVLDSYGRGMTLRTENAQRLEIIKEIPIDRLRKLAQAEKEGRLVVLQNVKYTDSDGEKALRHAMYMCGVQNNPVTRYTADAIAEKLTREAAEAALKEREAEHDR
nr:MAG TPA: hypothetical protein [Caudoviricetes sp.]